jgi:hypothetical protein
LAHGRREITDHRTIGDTEYTSYTEYVPGPGGGIEGAVVRLGRTETVDGLFGDTTKQFVKYFDSSGKQLGWVESVFEDGKERITKVGSYVDGAIALQPGDVRELPRETRSAAGLIPSTWDPQPDGRYGKAGGGTPSSTSTGGGSTSTSTTGGSSSDAKADTPGPGVGRDPSLGGDGASSQSSGTGGGSASGAEAQTDTPAWAAAADALQPESSSEPSTPQPQGSDASTDGLSLPEGSLAGNEGGDNSSTANVGLDDAGMTTVGGTERGDGYTDRDAGDGDVIRQYDDGRAETIHADGSREAYTGDKGGGSDDDSTEYVDNDAGGYSNTGPEPPKQQGGDRSISTSSGSGGHRTAYLSERTGDSGNLVVDRANAPVEVTMRGATGDGMDPVDPNASSGQLTATPEADAGTNPNVDNDPGGYSGASGTGTITRHEAPINTGNPIDPTASEGPTLDGTDPNDPGIYSGSAATAEMASAGPPAANLEGGVAPSHTGFSAGDVGAQSGGLEPQGAFGAPPGQEHDDAMSGPDDDLN